MPVTSHSRSHSGRGSDCRWPPPRPDSSLWAVSATSHHHPRGSIMRASGSRRPMLEREQSATAPAAPAGRGRRRRRGRCRRSSRSPNPGGRAPVLLLCDHAGRRIPAWLGGSRRCPSGSSTRHIAFDIGAADVTRRLAGLLDAPAVLCHVSRLVIDPNRLPGDPGSIPAISDGTLVPGNQELDAGAGAGWRQGRFSSPTTARSPAGSPACAAATACRRSSRCTVSRPPERMRAPWNVAVLWDTDCRLAAPVLAGLRRDPALGSATTSPIRAASRSATRSRSTPRARVCRTSPSRCART